MRMAMILWLPREARNSSARAHAALRFVWRRHGCIAGYQIGMEEGTHAAPASGWEQACLTVAKPAWTCGATRQAVLLVASN